MADPTFVDDDLVGVRLDGGGRVTLAFGDPIEILGRDGRRTKVAIGTGRRRRTGTVSSRPRTRSTGVLRFAMPDVQQGDGMVIETPEGKVILIDGGDNQLFARYLAARYPSSKQDPLEVDAIIVTHGDADHFAGLTKIRLSEKERPSARLFLYPKRIYHNGLAKGPKSLPPERIFGRTVATRDGRAIIDLVDDVRNVAKSKLNNPFKSWVTSLNHWAKHGPIESKRLAFGDKREFDFLRSEGIEVEVLGPITRRVQVRGKSRAALPLLREPPKAVTLPLDLEEGEPTGNFSASHTVNGHSVTLRITLGNVRFFLSGDHNQESMEALRRKVRPRDLQCEILKVPHHGSADFDLKTLKSHAPVVSLISSGDESSRKEHIHPRATVMGALGAASRGPLPLVFCTELAAFFEMRGMSKKIEDGKRYFGFERTNFGIIHVRTDGERVLVFTHSGKNEMKEAYRFRVDRRHKVNFQEVRKR